MNSQFLTIEGTGFDNFSLPNSTTTQVFLSIPGSSTSNSPPNCDIYFLDSNQIICSNLNLNEIGYLVDLKYLKKLKIEDY